MVPWAKTVCALREFPWSETKEEEQVVPRDLSFEHLPHICELLNAPW